MMFSKRWDYWLRTVQEGKVLDEPIPKIKWLTQPEDETRKNIESCLSYASSRLGSGSFESFVDWLLYGFGDVMQDEFPRRIDKDTNSHWYKEFNLGLQLKHPYDYLGQLAADKAGSGRWSNPTSFFPTPMNICQMITEMTMAGTGKDKTTSVCDPCVGSGRFLMTASNYSLNLYGMDIDHQVLKVCRANMWMYVPWGLSKKGISGLDPGTATEHGDSLKDMLPLQQVTKKQQEQLLKKQGQMRLFEFGGENNANA